MVYSVRESTVVQPATEQVVNSSTELRALSMVNWMGSFLNLSTQREANITMRNTNQVDTPVEITDYFQGGERKRSRVPGSARENV